MRHIWPLTPTLCAPSRAKGARPAAVHLLALTLLLTAAGCNRVSLPMMGRAAAPPPPRVELPAPVPEAAPATPLMRYYAQLQSDLVARGLLRSDDGSQDAPFDARILADTFIRVALYDEFSTVNGQLIARETESHLRRWQEPVRIGLHFGASISPERRAKETALIASYAARLSRASGHPISLSDHAPNFHIALVNETELRHLGPLLQAQMPGIAAGEVAAFTQMPISTYCQVSAAIDERSALYQRAFAVLRAEHSELMHLACLHEELAQGLGLPNDSPRARPSIFNDDQEFALLTPMDEMLLRILYDPRLRPGMTAAQARPIVDVIATELLGYGS